MSSTQADRLAELPPIDEEDRRWLSDNPNTSDIVDWIQRYALAALAKQQASPEAQDDAQVVIRFFTDNPSAALIAFDRWLQPPSAPQCEQAAAYAEARDNILNGRGPLEAVLDGDQTNAVLAVLDDAFHRVREQAALPGVREAVTELIVRVRKFLKEVDGSFSDELRVNVAYAGARLERYLPKVEAALAQGTTPAAGAAPPSAPQCERAARIEELESLLKTAVDGLARVEQQVREQAALPAGELPRLVTRAMHVACEAGVAEHATLGGEWRSLVERIRAALAQGTTSAAVDGPTGYIFTMKVETRHPTNYTLTDETNGERWRGTTDGVWKLEQAARVGEQAQADPNAPKEVFLQLYGADTPTGDPVDYTDGVSWCWHRIFESDVRYVQAAEANIKEKT